MALRTIRLFISSPGDVAEERAIARRLVGRLEAQFGGLVDFEAMLWERAPLEATATFQEQIVRPSEADVVVVILWSRLGTALPAHIVRADGTRYASGTEFEFEDAIASARATGKPRILAYMKTAPITPAGDLASLEEGTAQKRALDRFVAHWFRNAADGTLKGAFHAFATPADFEDLLDAHLTALAEHFVPAGVARAGTASWREGSPFRGLRVFEAEHAPVFFGRTAATATVLAKLRSQGQAGRAFVLIVSMSGAGKSSLIRAGVMPLLLQPGVVGDATGWRHAIFRPGDGQGMLVAPLARAVLGAVAIGGDDAGSEAEIGGNALVDALRVRLARASSGSIVHLALVVDQLEEVFSEKRVTVAERDAFFATLDALARSGVVWILSSMRSDAYERIAETPTLVSLKEGDGQVDLLPPSVREIGQIIRLPAAAAGLRFESRPDTAEKLDDVIRDAAARNPAALPLLQFLLEELYQRRSADDVLTFKAYDELGGVEGALAQHAEQVLARTSASARASLATVLRELVAFSGGDERPLRRVAPMSAFTSPGARELIDALLEARLLVSGSATDGSAVVSLAHEALLEFWPRLKAWVDEDRELLLVHSRLETATREWERNGRSEDLLLARGKPLAEARQLEQAGIRLDANERALLDASVRRARRFAVLRGGAIVGLAVLTVVAGIAAWRARVESGRAQVQATTAQRTTDFMVGLFANADPDQSKGDKVTVRDVLDRGILQIDRELAGEEGVRANLLRAMGQAYNGLGLYPKAHEILQNALAQSERSGNPDDQIKARLALAENRFQESDFDTAGALYRTAREQARSLHGAIDELGAQAVLGLAETLAEDGKTAEAEPLFRDALAMNLSLHGERSLEVARTLDGEGRLLFATGRYPEAQSDLERALDLRRTILGEADGSVALSLNNLGSLYFRTGQIQKAVEAFGTAIPSYQRIFGPEHVRVARVLVNLGYAELMDNRLGSAKEHLEQTVALVRKAYGTAHPDLILPLNNLGLIATIDGDYASAHKSFEEAFTIAKPRKHWVLEQLLGNEAMLAVREGRLGDAQVLLDDARTTQKAQYGVRLQGADAWRLGVLESIGAELDFARGDRDGATRQLSTSFTLLRSHFSEQAFYLVLCRKLEDRMNGVR